MMADVGECIDKLIAAGQIIEAIGDEAREMFRRFKAEYSRDLGTACSATARVASDDRFIPFGTQRLAARNYQDFDANTLPSVILSSLKAQLMRLRVHLKSDPLFRTLVDLFCCPSSHHVTHGSDVADCKFNGA
jgi:hypothetical protein